MNNRLACRRCRGIVLAVLTLAALALLPWSVRAAEPGGLPAEARLPALGWVTPFAAMLLCIALLPLLPHARHWWESNWVKLAISVTLALITAGFYLFRPFGMLHTEAPGHKEISRPGWPTLWLMLNHAVVDDYVPFVVLLFSLYVISGGIQVRTRAAPTPAVNTLVLALGAGLASFLGTTGASMLLIRPLLQINRGRRHAAHTVVFFIFVVANLGGCLTPLGDPPLFLGYLRGVPFAWNLTLWPEWLVANGAVLLVYYRVDRRISRREAAGPAAGVAASRSTLSTTPSQKDGLMTVRGAINFVWLAGVLLAVAWLIDGQRLAGTNWILPAFAREGALVVLAGLSWVTTPKGVRAANGFNFHAINEVACLFLGIFTCMQVPLELLKERGGQLGLSQPWHFFWATGLLSSVLDNAPTYAVFFEIAAAPGAGHGALLHGVQTIDGTIPGALLQAVSLGAVFMGATTYIGNGPNFMVRSIAEEAGVKLPSFFGYLAYSAGTLGPLFVVLTLVFFR